MHSCQLLILVSSFIQTPQVEPRGHLIPLIQWTLQFVHRSCQVKCLHADSKGLGFRKSPLLTGTKTMKGFQYNAKAHHLVQRNISHTFLGLLPYLEQATPRSFLSSSNPIGLLNYKRGTTMEPINQVAFVARSIFPGF
jgi:hypothetical protein